MTNPAAGAAYPFWREVEKQRIQQGLSKAFLSERTGLGRTTIDRLQDGKRPPRASTVHALADLLGIDRRKAEALAGLTPADAPAPSEGAGLAAVVEPKVFSLEQVAKRTGFSLRSLTDGCRKRQIEHVHFGVFRGLTDPQIDKLIADHTVTVETPDPLKGMRMRRERRQKRHGQPRGGLAPGQSDG